MTQQHSITPSKSELFGLLMQSGGANRAVSIEWLEPFAQAILARWGRPALKPVPVSERSPKAKDCNAQGNCWLTNDSLEPGWVLDNPEKCTNWTHWVPHWAMPVATK
jgi:hypothetical protein